MTTHISAKRRFIDLDDPILKRLLRDGFALPHDPDYGLVVLLRGKPGTGKSTLALQLLDRVALQAGSRYYCTLEQSSEDLEFKLGSMLAATALQEALQPDYPSKVFDYRTDPVWDYLKDRLNQDIQTGIETLWSGLEQQPKLPLFHEPNKEQSGASKKLHRSFSDLVSRNLKPDRIIICDTSSATQLQGYEGPLGSFRSRVVLAPHLLEKPLGEADRIDTTWKAPREDAAREAGLANQGATGTPKRPREERDKLPVVVLDGLSLLSVPEREVIELQCLVESMRRNFQLSILVYEPNEDESTSLDHHADMVIELVRRTIEKPLAYTIHELCIRKARYQEAALGQHQFKIRGSGIAVFPSLHFQVHHHNYMDLELKRSSSVATWKPTSPETRGVKHFDSESASKPGSIIDLIFDPQDGESVVLLGSRNSFKTQLCLDFLSRGFWGCPCNPDDPKAGSRALHEKGLLVSLIDNAPDIERGLDCPWHKSLHGTCKLGDKDCKNCTSHLLWHARSFCQRPGCITPAEFFYYFRERILPTINGKESDEPCVERVVFWDLTQMDYRFPLFKEDKMLLPALMDFLKTREIKALFMGAGNADNTKAASAMADHVLFCWRSSFLPRERKENAAHHLAEGKAVAEVPDEGDSIASLMLYVDRTSAASGRSGKVLYRIPIYQDDKLKIPNSRSELDTSYRLLPSVFKDDSENKVQIDRITNMQGVA
jgi:KaiC/GvpD/RAD55 family RecA-like ATPase